MARPATPLPRPARGWPLAALRRALTPPPELAGADRRFVAITRIGVLLGLCFHMAFLAVFAALGLWMLAAFNLFSVALFAVCIVLVARRKLTATFWLAGCEVTAHAVLATAWLGLDAGFQFYLLVQAAVVLLAPLYTYRQRVTVALGYVAILLALVAWAANHEPLAAVDPGWLLVFGLGNLSGLALVAGAIVMVWVATVDRTERALEVEYARSESLLANMMPAAIAARLKDAPGTIAERFESATVLFADIVDFTGLAGRMPADALVRLLDEVFSAFDALVETRGLEKIKTIGDAYMVVAGLPTPRDDHAEAIVDLARAMLIEAARHHDDTGQPLRLRIGVNSGRVVAGVIGRRKFAYDLWGDTVNMAARMESSGLPGAIQLTQATRDLLPATYRTTPRGPVEIKGKGQVATWLLD
ncbi:MAG: adenylate/guanylate cyclase domain-containing protein [Alphaproteobacteria bacterium]